MAYVTILGSCRQQPISKYFNVSSIQDSLNYPHYTKEILQQIRYLKYKSIASEQTKFCFRSSLLNKCQSPISEDHFLHLNNEFNKSSFFLIEIASRISYKWESTYLHHIAEEPQYNFYDRDRIMKEYLSDEDIENDIIEIRNELYPKPFIIVSHFATYKTGKRYELIKLLEKICLKFNIPFLNQSDIVEKYGENILVKETILSHYTTEGLNLVGNILFDKINEVKKNPTKQKLYQVYYTSEERVKKHSFHGFGDFIKGAIHLYQLTYGTNVELKINFSNHNLSKLFVCDNHLSIDECENTTYIHGHEKIDLHKVNHVYTNKDEFTNISVECKEFIKKKCLTPRIAFQEKMSNIKQALNLIDFQYSIIHLRLDDNETFNPNRLKKILDIIHWLTSNSSETFILIASNDMYLKHINYPSIIKTNLESGHIGLHTTSLTQCENTMLEFMLMTTSKRVYQLSVYCWGSGFSDTVNKIYDVEVLRCSI
jgi:hypothetical protein